MANELAIIESNWLELAEDLAKMPAPYEQEIFLYKTSVAGTSHVDDIEAKTNHLAVGDELILKREPTNAYDAFAIAVQTDRGERIGWVPRRRNEVFSRLLDGGKRLVAKLDSKEPVEGQGWVDMRMKIYLKDA